VVKIIEWEHEAEGFLVVLNLLMRFEMHISFLNIGRVFKFVRLNTLLNVLAEDETFISCCFAVLFQPPCWGYTHLFGWPVHAGPAVAPA